MNNTAYTYSDVLIKPKYSEIASRSTVDLSTKIGPATLKLPIISANMKTVTGPKMAATMSLNGGMGLLHRFCSVEQSIEDLKDIHEYIMYNAKSDMSYTWPGVSIGVKEEDRYRFEKLYEAGARIFCIDVAHGHHVLVKNILHWINSEILSWDRSQRNKILIIAGNVATPEGYEDLVTWGADAVKVGIGPGSACKTRANTGVGVPQLYALQTVHEQSMTMDQPVPIIADGGINSVGDIAKALKYADAVMLGSMLAGTSETPGHVYRNEDNEFYKVYGGSASGENKESNTFVEGVMKTIKFKGKVKYILREIEHGLQSAFSYVGASNLAQFQDKCEFVRLSNGSRGESKI